MDLDKFKIIMSKYINLCSNMATTNLNIHSVISPGPTFLYITISVCVIYFYFGVYQRLITF